MTRVRAVIIEQGKLLTIHRVKGGKEYWVFPGGGIEPHEDPTTALVRECLEELGVHVRVGELMYEHDGHGFFRCEITGGALGTGTGEEHTARRFLPFYGVFEHAWIPLDALAETSLVPDVVRDLVAQHAGATSSGR